ncbi:MAG: septum formation protein Maf [Rikenellaceae bacterium]|nr:septum formation protein Maf [Rikenellaceae bacterium]
MLLHDILKNYRLILASQSPRRRQLLSDCGLEYELAERYEVEEVFPATMEADEVPVYLSRLKSEGYPTELAENDILLTADTVVIVDNEILGKPADEAEAHAMLRTLSGRAHRVTTGVTLRSKSRTESFAVQSDVYFRALTDEEIDYYVERYRPMDKAGSYGIQEWIGYVGIECIDGSFYNVMGLPVQRVYAALGEFVK